MKIHQVEQGTDAWLALRKGKLTGTNSKYVVAYRDMLKADLIGEALDRGCEFDEKKVKVEELKDMILAKDPSFSFRVMEEKFNEDFEYKMLAIELVGDESEPEENENPLARGHDLEPVARKLFEQAKGKVVDEIGFITCDEEDRMGLSPDGLVKNGGVYTEGLEIKSPCAWKYLKYWIKNEIPDEYKDQCLDYFVISPEVERVFLMIYNPRIVMHPYHIFKIERQDYEHEIRVMKNAQLQFWKAHDARMDHIKALAASLKTT